MLEQQLDKEGDNKSMDSAIIKCNAKDAKEMHECWTNEYDT